MKTQLTALLVNSLIATGLVAALPKTTHAEAFEVYHLPREVLPKALPKADFDKSKRLKSTPENAPIYDDDIRTDRRHEYLHPPNQTSPFYNPGTVPNQPSLPSSSDVWQRVGVNLVDFLEKAKDRIEW